MVPLPLGKQGGAVSLGVYALTPSLLRPLCSFTLYEGQRAPAATERGRLKPRLNGLRPRNLPAQGAEEAGAQLAFWRPRRRPLRRSP